MSAAIEQALPGTAGGGGGAAVFVDVDLEANNARPDAAATGSAAEQAAVEVVDIESGSSAVPPSPGDSPSGRSMPGTFAHWDALALLLGLVSVVCLTILTGELLNGWAPSPIITSLFVLCAFTCMAVLRRQRATAAASRALEHRATILSTSHHPRPPSTLDHEARRFLFDYFVFSHPAKDRGQNDDNDGVKDSSSKLQGDKEEEASAITTTNISVVAATAIAGPIADGKVPPSEETGMRRGTPEDWTTAAACVVCFGEYSSGDNLCRLPCRHTYHAKCVDQWLDKANHPCCPMCKADLLALYHESSGGTVATAANDTASINSSSNNNDETTTNNNITTPTNSSDNDNSNNNDETSQLPVDSQEEITGSA